MDSSVFVDSLEYEWFLTKKTQKLGYKLVASIKKFRPKINPFDNVVSFIEEDLLSKANKIIYDNLYPEGLGLTCIHFQDRTRYGDYLSDFSSITFYKVIEEGGSHLLCKSRHRGKIKEDFGDLAKILKEIPKITLINSD